MSAEPRTIALVTGASSEVGGAIARALAALGFAVIGTSRTAPSEQSFSSHIAADLDDPAAPDLIADAATGTAVLVHAAGHRFDYTRLHMQSDADRARIRRIEYEAFEALCVRLLPSMMTRRSGRVVAVTSLAARVGGQGAAVYGAAKAASEALIRGIAIEYGRFGITANAIAPGPIQNARLAARLAADPAAARALSQRAALRRLVTPDEVAAAVAFVAGPGGGGVTGQVLTVAAGIDLNSAW